MTADDRTPDDLPLRFTARFGFGLLIYLLIGMSLFIGTAGKYDGKPSAQFFAVPAAAMAIAMIFALFARFKLRWRGFLRGGSLGTGKVMAPVVAFFWLATRSIPPKFCQKTNS